MFSNKLIFFIALVLALSAIALGEPTAKTVTVQSASRFCLLVPKSGNDKPISFCTELINAIPFAKVFRPGFIRSVHYRKQTNRYAQVTGRIDRHVYGLSNHDQRDPNSPLRAKCLDYPYFVQYIDPVEQIYCLRCCKNMSDCPTNRSEDGCRPHHWRLLLTMGGGGDTETARLASC